MIHYPEIDPIALSLGPLQVRWYGLTYLLGFVTAWLLGRYRASRPGSSWSVRDVDDFVTYAVLALIVGARVGYVAFYGWNRFLADPSYLLRVWEGGMSFHGGALGIAACMVIFARLRKKSLGQVADFFTPLAPPGLFFGRLGNFINGELWGRETSLPWGLLYPAHMDPTGTVRHPSQIYEALLEGVVFFLILWFYSARTRPRWAVAGLFLLGYGCFRLAVEFVREPDAQLGFLAFGWVTMGQLLSLPMILCGALLFLWANRRDDSGQGPAH